MAEKFIYTGSVFKDKKSVYDIILEEQNKPKNAIANTGIYTGSVFKDKQPSRQMTGVGYIGGSFGVGIASPFEGITDLITASAAWITGDKDYAEYIYKNNVTGGWQNSLDDKYLPGKGMKTTGEIASGVGQAVSYIAMTLATSGIASGAAGGSAAASSAAAKAGAFAAKNAPIFLSATGSATGEAVQTTGELGGKEMIYGAAVGAMETGLEQLSAVGGIVGKATGKTGAVDKAFSKVVKNTVARGIISDAAGEFVEESLSELGGTWLKRWTGVDPEASTSAGQVLRAGLIGAASGAILGVGEAGVGAAIQTNTGRRLQQKGSAEATVKTARLLLDNVGRLTYEGVSQDILDLKASVESYEKSPSALTLGKIASQMYTIETKSIVNAEKARILATLNDETVAKVNALVPKPNGTWTMEDIRNNEGNIATIYATVVYANKLGQMTGDNSTTAQAIESTVANDLAQVETDMETTVNSIKGLADGGFVAYKMPIGTTVVVKTKDGYRVGVYTDRASSNAEWSGIVYKTEKEAYDAMKLMNKVSTQETKKTPTTEAVESEKQERKPNPQHVGTPKKPTRKQIKKAKQQAKKEAKLAEQKAKEEAAKAEEKKSEETKEEAPKKEAKTQEAKQETTKPDDGSPFDRKYTKEDMKLCREMVDDFDFLPVKLQDRLLNTARTGRQSKATEQQIKEAIAFSYQAKTTIAFSNAIKADGFFTSVDGDYLIVVHPKDSRTATVIHEMAHRMKKTGGWDALAKYVRKVVGEEKFNAIRENYKKSYDDWRAEMEKGGTVVPELSEEQLDEEAVADALAYYLKKVPYLENKASKGFIKKAFASIKSIVDSLKNQEFATYKTAVRIQRAYEKMLTVVEQDQAMREVEKILAEYDKRYSLVGITADGIEVYETSKKVLNLPWKDRKKLYLSYITQTYIGRTAKFVRNGHVYYAEFDRKNARKAIYGDGRSDVFGLNALINTGADGSIFELVENATYDYSKKDTKNHSSTDYFDYFIKTVQIDNKVFDLLADVRKQYYKSGGFVYTIKLVENKTIKASPIQRGQALLKNSGNALTNGSIPHSPSVVNSEFEEIDSEGKKLTPEQQEYFKDSKVRDKYGRLLVVYHGSTSEFTVFKQSKIGSHGNAHGRGFYFTESKSLASSYQKEGGQLLEGYLDIKNPMSEDKITIKKSSLLKLIKTLSEMEAKAMVEDGGYDSIRDALPDTFVSNYVNTYEMPILSAYQQVTDIIYNANDNDVDILAELTNAGASKTDVLEKAYEILGYDGVIFENPDGVHEFVTFTSNQFKNADNKNPTSDPDIRYSPSSSRDTTYLDAVNRGDMETAQRMVDEAAREAGYTVKAYHGTNNDFTVFSRNRIMSNTEKSFYGRGFYFSTSEQDAKNYGSRILSVYLRVGKTLDLDSESWTYDIGIEKKKSKIEVQKTHIESAPRGFINIHYTTKDAPLDWKSISNVSPNQITDDKSGKKYVEKKLNPESSILPRDIKNLDEVARNKGYDSIKGSGTNIGDIGTEYVVFDEARIKFADPVTYDDNGDIIPLSKRFDSGNPDIRYSPSRTSYAPTFYSRMGKEIDAIRSEKVSAGGLIPFLKGKGVKDEEIKWSGIEAFLEGKKSVTKAELQEFVAGSQLQIEEEMSGALEIEVFSDDGDNYKVRNKASGAILDEWEYSEDVEDGLDGWVNQEGEIALTVDEIREKSFAEFSSTRWSEMKLKGGDNYRELVFKMPNTSYSNYAMRVHWGEDADGVLAHARIQDFTTDDGKRMLFIEEIQSDWHNQGSKSGYKGDVITREYLKKIYEVRKIGTNSFNNLPVWTMLKKRNGEVVGSTTRATEQEVWDAFEKNLTYYHSQSQVPDAPFKSTYHEYVLKRLIRMAAEEGYDSIGWTTAEIQSKRWSDEYAEGFRIEYDQDIPKFLRKYGKKWGATVDTKTIGDGEEVWSMDITDSMKESVLYEGQPMYSPSASSPDPNNPYDHVDTTMPKKEKLTRAEARLALKEFFESAQIELTNQQAGIENFLVRVGKMKKAEAAAYVQAVRTSESYGIGAVTTGQYSADGKRVGDGLFQILSPLWDEKSETWNEELFHEFSVYITNLHNIDRQREDKPVIPYTTEEITGKVNKLKSKMKDALLQAEAEGKSEKVKAEIEAEYTKKIRDIERPYAIEMSQKAVEQYERQHPEFREIADKLSAFNRNLNQYRVDTGLLSQEVADELNKKYPYYVPTYRVEDGMVIGTGSLKGRYNFEVQQSVKTAKGSDKVVDNPLLTYIHQTISTYKAGRVNELMRLVHDNADGVYVVTEESKKPKTELEADDETGATEYAQAIDRTNNELTYYKNGKKVSMKVYKNIFSGFEGFTTSNTSAISSMIIQGFAWVNNLFKSAVTSWNPFFLASNFFKDTGDALFYSKFGAKKWAEARIRAQAMIQKNDPLWQEYISMGGLQSSIYEYERGFSGNMNDRGMLRRAQMHKDIHQKVENVNIIIEQASRFAEYILSREAGLSVQESMLNAADVTINFSRGGRLVKMLNKTIMPFLNPAVQGMSKMERAFFEDRTVKDILSLVLKCTALGILPMVLANLMYGNDDEYDDLQDTVKENNYLFKIGDTWIKIPKGRVQAVLSGAYNRTERAVTGKTVDFMDYLSNVASQATPLSNISRTIFSPFKDVQTNTTWYGGSIENQSDALKAPSERYDEYTSGLSKTIGRIFNYSPKKIDYLIDQNTGVIGDILLPATTSNSNIFEAFGKMATQRFVVNEATSSRLSSEFYDIYEKNTYKKTAGDEEAWYINKFLTEYKDAASELYDQMSEIQADETLSTADKNAQSKALRVLINQTYKSAMQDLETYKSALSAAMGVNGSFEVVEITKENRRQYDCDKDDIGRYAVLYDDRKYRLYDTKEDADKYVTSIGRKMTYAESIRLVYGAERAIKAYNGDLYTKAQALNSLGIGYEIYYNAYFGTQGMNKDQTEQYIASLGLKKSQKAVLMYALGYTAYKSQAKKEIKDKSIQEALNLK